MSETPASRRASFPARLVEWVLILPVRFYQFTVSPVLHLLFGPCCRFQPSCSQYFILAVRKHGPLRGLAKGISRISRCHPWHQGGYDPP